MEFDIPEVEFLFHLTGHRETTKRVQRWCYQQIKQQMRGSSETNILKQLLLSRLTAAIDNGSDLFGLSRLQAHDDEEKFLEGIDALVSLYPNLELLIDAMIQDDKSRGPVIPTSLRFEDVARRIGAILAER